MSKETFTASVKPLEWKRNEHNSNKYLDEWGTSAFGGHVYRVTDLDGYFYADLDQTLPYRSEEEAKAACQARHDARVKALLIIEPKEQS